MIGLRRLLPALAGLAFALHAAAASAQGEAYPNKPVSIVVSYPAGGPVDALARLLAQSLQKQFGQPFVVENRPGAAGVIGHSYVSRAAPNGYTLLFAADPVQTILPHFQTISNYDPLKDYTPIGTLVDSVFGIFVNQDSKIKSLSDLIAAAKANPGQLKYGSAGIGSGNQLVTMLLEQKTGTKMLHVPFSGGAPANLALLSGSVDFMIISISSVLDQIEAGKLKALAVASAQRQKSLPNVPTADEAGVKDYTASSWFGLQGPPGLPPAIVATLNDAMKKALKDPDFASATAKLGYSPEVGAPETMKQRIDTSYKLWGDLVKAANQNATK